MVLKSEVATGIFHWKFNFYAYVVLEIVYFSVGRGGGGVGIILI